MKYFTQPPIVEYGTPNGDIPRFMRKSYKGKRFTNSYILKLIYWSESEYNDTLNWSISRGDRKFYSFVKSLSPLHVLALSAEFKELIQYMTNDIWNNIPSAIQKILSKTYNIYKGV